ncbi:alcohol dehydrogenase catalytic domain-containing protein [Nocardia miyunensis]|uniref:alcohol dehydrogenase catalytic domain-containing protein n=1 Tax=Nocardia miyunensis TaxID=282684 RepID=UPI00082B54A5|nr:alcohol dehydrogenase catalytic domain-containing protein [Nocardia miyunensis]
MKALKYKGVNDVGFVEVPIPEPGPAQVRLKVTACGVCHTDTSFRSHPGIAVRPGLTLGHEIAGRVESLGPGVASPALGTEVVVHTIWSCGSCRQCVRGRENACLSTDSRLTPPQGPGTRFDGGMAEYVVVPAKSVVPTIGLAPETAAVLPDAAIVPYHAIDSTRDLLAPGASVLVIGVGGLGQFAVSILRAVTATHIVAVDIRESVLESLGDRVDAALNFRSTQDLTGSVLTAAGGHGPDLVLDFVGTDETLRLAGSVVAPYGTVWVPGQEGGTFTVEADRRSTVLPRGAAIVGRPYGGTRRNLVDVIELATAGSISVPITTYPFEKALQAFDDLDGGRVRGRAVLTME